MSIERQNMLANQPECSGFADPATQTLEQDIDRDWLARGMARTCAIELRKIARISSATQDNH